MGIFKGEGFEVDAGEIEKGVLIVGAKVAVGLIVCGVRTVKSCMDLSLNGVEGIQY